MQTQVLMHVIFQFVEQPTLTSVAQTVVDKVVRLHHDNYLTKQRNVTTRDDISLIIRNFNFPLRGALTPSSAFPGGISPRPPLRHLPCSRPQVRNFCDHSFYMKVWAKGLDMNVNFLFYGTFIDCSDPWLKRKEKWWWL